MYEKTHNNLAKIANEQSPLRLMKRGCGDGAPKNGRRAARGLLSSPRVLWLCADFSVT